MRNPSPLLAPLVALALVASACSGNNPQQPLIVQAGWSWNPALAADRPLPVVWKGTAAPEVLPLLPGGDCGASGSVQALAKVDEAPFGVGISVACSGGKPTMLPVTWQGGTVTPLPLPGTYTQGTALAVATANGSVFVAGASGDAFPMPTIWKDGALGTRVPGNLLPPFSDSGLITALVATEKYAVAVGVIHLLATDPPQFQGIVWVLDPDFTSVQGTVLIPPFSLNTGSFGGSVVASFDGLQLYTAAALELDGAEQPVFWLDTNSFPILSGDYAVGPWGVPTGIQLLGTVPYLTGYVRTSDPAGRPEPVIWTPAASMVLSTADASAPIGAAEAITLAYGWAFAGGETLGRDPSNSLRALSVPACWTNGDRQDLPALVPPGGGPALSGPLFGWWSVPGTGTTPATWPYPGGFAQVLRTKSVSAAGSAVLRTIMTIP
jgi:hypothetical protein